MTKTKPVKPVTTAPLYPFLVERGISFEQVEALEIELFIERGTGPAAEGSMILLPVALVLAALKALDNHPWKDTSPVEFRKHLQAEIKATGIKFWITGAEALALEGKL